MMIFAVNCLTVSLYEHFDDSKTDGGELGLVLVCWLDDAIVRLMVGSKWGSDRSRISKVVKRRSDNH